MRGALLRPVEQSLEEVSVVPVDGSQLVALMEGELCGGTQARHVESAQLTDSET